MIELNNITVLKQGQVLFKNFNLTLGEGEHWLVQGENGSGKTSLLAVIAGDLPVNDGQVRYSFIDDRVHDWDERYRERKNAIHFIPAHALHHFLGEHQGLFYQQRYYTLGDVDLPNVRDFFGADVGHIHSLNLPDSFDIRNLLPLELTRLSNGQLKKILIIRHLLRNIPKVLLLDYPFEGLDRESRVALSDFIGHLVRIYKIQIILTDHHHPMPDVINRRLVLNNFTIERTETVVDDNKKKASGRIPVTPNVQANNRQPVVEMRGLTIQYGSKKIIEDLNWKIQQGERWALTGRNGSGKTTLFSLIYADHPMAYSQQVYLFGRRRGTGESIWDIKSRINYLGPEQIHFLDPAATRVSAKEYILSTKCDAEAELRKLVAFFDAGKFINTPVRHLSSGQLQLMLLIRFFLSGKELLLLDEPFQFLNPSQKDRVVEYLNGFLSEHSTLVLITHYEDDIRTWTQHRMELR